MHSTLPSEKSGVVHDLGGCLHAFVAVHAGPSLSDWGVLDTSGTT